jgi:hypothetical protein
MINDQLFLDFMKQLGDVRANNEDLILELMTQGGDADTARRIALEIRVFQIYSGKNAYAVGKTAVMSAGTTIFSAFECADRVEREDFEHFVKGSGMSTEDLPYQSPTRSRPF